MRNYVVVVFAGLALAVLTGASPIADLLSRVKALEADNETLVGQVGSLEAENTALNAEVASLKGESDKQPVVVDANGVEVGTVIGASGKRARVLLEFEGFPPFLLEVFRERLQGNEGNLAYASSDCSGPALIEASGDDDPLPAVFHMTDGSGSTFFYLGAAVTERIPVKSAISANGICSAWDASVLFASATPVPQMQGLFTPPFQVVTRGDLLSP